MININLLPSELKAKRVENKKNASLIGFCFVLVLVVAVVAIIGKSLEQTIKANLTTLKNNATKTNVLNSNDTKLEEMALIINDRWQTVQAIDKNSVIWSLVLQDLNNSVPYDVQIENITANVDKKPNFVLQGNTINEREIIKFKEKLENSLYFKNVSFKSASIQKSEDPNQTEKLKFTLEFDLEKSTK